MLMVLLLSAYALASSIFYFFRVNFVDSNQDRVTDTRSDLPFLLRALNETEIVLLSIRKRWNIDQYPRFLKSASIPHHSWELMKQTLIQRTLRAHIEQNETAFVISFMGSSVTAGHDSPFNDSFPLRTWRLMNEPFGAASVRLEVRNVALGNNPCVPYDLCPRTFAGEDADLVLWEQSYNCFGDQPRDGFVFEQFIRQAIQQHQAPHHVRPHTARSFTYSLLLTLTHLTPHSTPSPHSPHSPYSLTHSLLTSLTSTHSLTDSLTHSLTHSLTSKRFLFHSDQ